MYDEDETIIGDYYADLFINDQLVVELKAVKNILDDHIALIIGYLRASKIEYGLLINCGSSKLQIKKYIWKDQN